MSEFAGHLKKGECLFAPIEKRLVKKFTPKIPKFIETYHLTYMTIIWSGLIILFSYLANSHIHYLWLVSLMIFFQYITDLFDGAVGRHRNTGLVKWGYFMDHFLDYIFLASIMIGYAFLLPISDLYLHFFLTMMAAGFMVSSYLAFAATNEFQITHFRVGPTEMRLLFIIVNALLVIFGIEYLSIALPYATGLTALGLLLAIYRTHRHIWQLDMEAKASSS